MTLMVTEIIIGYDKRGRPLIGYNQRGRQNNNWKGGRYKDSSGYFILHKPDHPFATTRGYVKEHRAIWEFYNNATLLPWAAVHHINGIRDDNRIENLIAMNKSTHARTHRLEEVAKSKILFGGHNQG